MMLPVIVAIFLSYFILQPSNPIGIFRRIGLVLPPHLCVHQNPELHRTFHQTTETRLSHSQTQTRLQGMALRSLTAQSVAFSRRLGLPLPCF